MDATNCGARSHAGTRFRPVLELSLDMMRVRVSEGVSVSVVFLKTYILKNKKKEENEENESIMKL